MPSSAIKYLSAKVTLHNEVQAVIKSGDILVVTNPCTDIADSVLYTISYPKVLNRGDMITVKDYFTIVDTGFKAVRGYVNNKLYYIDSLNLTTLQLF